MDNVMGVCLVCGKDKTQHGKIWEQPVCNMFIDELGYSGKDKQRIFDIWRKNSEKDTTAEHDIDDTLMRGSWTKAPRGFEMLKKYGDGISVKLIKHGCDVCMGKLDRIFKHFERPWSMIVGFYEEKEINGVSCLCIEEVYFLPFINPKKNRIDFFGEVDDNWTETYDMLEKTVKEARSYKGGKNGVSGLINNEIPFKPFEDLPPQQQTDRKNGGTDKGSSPKEIKQACLECYKKLKVLQHKVSSSPETPAQTAIKISSSNARVQGRVSYSQFIKLVEKLGTKITHTKPVIQNNLIEPIKKMVGGIRQRKTKKGKKRSQKHQ